MSRWNINHKFQFADGDYRKGTATLLFEEDDLEQDDTYTMTITAQDLIGNVSRLSVDLEVSPGNSIDGELSLDHVFTYPNPFRVGETTRFFFHHTKPYGDEEATIRIYTLSGKLVKVFRNARDGQEWNGTDAFGRRLGPNAYLYRVSVRMGEGRQTEESDIKKVVIHPPR
jgi:flagellar hook assembly protein FlgD